MLSQVRSFNCLEVIMLLKLGGEQSLIDSMNEIITKVFVEQRRLHRVWLFFSSSHRYNLPGPTEVTTISFPTTVNCNEKECLPVYIPKFCKKLSLFVQKQQLNCLTTTLKDDHCTLYDLV